MKNKEDTITGDTRAAYIMLRDLILVQGETVPKVEQKTRNRDIKCMSQKAFRDIYFERNVTAVTSRDTVRQRFSRVMKNLKAMKYVSTYDGWVWLP
jgi:hypothetical protein